ncbi:MAG: 2-amino-4-hydroxy-6-hydroxymethyldihydropteridine diphosphokinase [Chitinophagaceae bacterium]|jgi:2-amino-4-hydroxy-6-hydroxymethyldihydropteridine diphosphokinase|nr:2-amino-4-hydroxy-6-hydroxymethyldihydropteridine diphosphokinase [Chitinophagaceae bacterium]OQY95930.1 MAG: 2-amino-4-hydroxy-6-hydroxymethyldihydropteridine diphosphokinase [Sphingobacteriales bacterium UTBCD1]
MNKAYLLTGTNLGDRLKNIMNAAQNIQDQCGTIALRSSIYKTAAWGNTDQPDFLNQVLELNTALTARHLLKHLQQIEQQMGRIRTEKYGPRIIDIDILFFNDAHYRLGFLKIPHPEIQNRRFVLVPMTEIAPMLFHPVLKKTMSELLKDCSDQLEVRKYS